ncbi:hypothetical protein GA0061071_107170 [Kosakonia oryzendophytica]|uniref:DUF5675 domain-containing protein n=1 Tax=Kosakonia oryzendophytica TaxID=1005665 RepID=A0A1C4CEZ4_9ENTR|nr:DUF5675 family protein [Kosakonia oryzendophytica]TDT59264.1 hypothetical protein DFO53_0835 [Enterobacter sp. AG5470]WBT60211.1 DUF5675 family protein [Kosakonia oryzendophytica]SCC17578.1 hypothetical protein GA0061071_107170 [Kosakonia oryzendophytica]
MANYLISVKRLWETNNSTISTYEISGSTIKGYFLERPGPDTTVSGQLKRIPEGSYRLKWHNSNISSVQAHNPVPLLYNADVPQSRYILIHNGNYPYNTEGCLLIGGSKGTDFVGGSVPKLTELKTFLTEHGIENFTLMITSCYVTCNNQNG